MSTPDVSEATMIRVIAQYVRKLEKTYSTDLKCKTYSTDLKCSDTLDGVADRVEANERLLAATQRALNALSVEVGRPVPVVTPVMSALDRLPKWLTTRHRPQI